MTESQFMQVAIQRYADACTPPSRLQPDCPFLDVRDPAECLKQCRGVQRRLLRVRSEDRVASSFDAGMYVQISKSRSPIPDALWDPVALVTVFVKVMRSLPFLGGAGHLHRTIAGTQALGELAILGLDPHLLLGAFADEYALGLDAAIGLDLSSGDDAERPTHREGWVRLRGSAAGAKYRQLDPGFRRAVSAWVRTAPPEWVIDRRPPDSLPEPPAGRLGREQESEYRWLATRLSETYLDAWSLEAIEMEYRYVADLWAPSAVPTVLADLRTESRAAVADALAQKHIAADRDPELSRTRDAFTKQAINLVESGDVAGAATLLGVACELHPEDWSLANNHGFCLIPLDPVSAIGAFARSRVMAPRTRPIPLVEANDALAHLRAGRVEQAVQIVRGTATETVPDDPMLLWLGEGGGFDGQLEAKWIPLREYWALLVDFMSRRGPSSGQSAAATDAVGQ